jgi:hypothetical protein
MAEEMRHKEVVNRERKMVSGVTPRGEEIGRACGKSPRRLE